MAIRTIEQLMKRFADFVVAQDDAIRKGDIVAGNRCARHYEQAWRELRRHGNPGRDALATLLEDDRPSVRILAAACLLKHCTDRAQQVLREASKGTGLAAFEAAQALERWEEGDWHLDSD